jgi:hypothetical protein
VFRSGHKYVVPYVDTLGRDRRQEFETLPEARDFRAGIRTVEKAKSLYSGPSPGPYTGGGEH